LVLFEFVEPPSELRILTFITYELFVGIFIQNVVHYIEPFTCRSTQNLHVTTYPRNLSKA